MCPNLLQCKDTQETTAISSEHYLRSNCHTINSCQDVKSSRYGTTNPSLTSRHIDLT